MVEPRRMDRLTGQDLLMLWPDDFGWPDDVGALAILDGTRLLDPDGRVRIEAIRLAPRDGGRQGAPPGAADRRAGSIAMDQEEEGVIWPGQS
jgi:hypothetical protein